MKRLFLSLVAILALLVTSVPVVQAAPGNGNGNIGINVVLNTEVTDQILADIGKLGKVRDVIPSINALTLQAKASQLEAIKAKPYVAAANPDAERTAAPIDTVAVDNFLDGLSTWNLDAINVTDFGFDNRQVAYDGTGVYVAVLDTGLIHSWRQYFPEERIAEEYAKSFSGGANDNANVSEQPNKWEKDVNSHGTHVTSTILGYSLNGTPINGVAPMVTVIPVKVLNQNGSGSSGAVAAGISYIADLKAGPLSDYPVVINMSLGGPELDAMEKAAIDYAISQGVIIVASAGNEGEAGMGYPGAYEPVISVGATGFIGQWLVNTWWYSVDAPEPTNPNHYYIADFSSRQLAGQDLDVVAPGAWVVGPYQLNSSNQTSYYYLGGTSMASPHVAGIVALMAQKYPALAADQAEAILETTAIPLAAGCRNVINPNTGAAEPVCWGADATGHGLATADAALNATP